MNTTITRMKKNMEDILRGNGYYLKVSIKKDGYYVSTDAVNHADSITLYYINSHTPAEVVGLATKFFDKLNGK